MSAVSGDNRPLNNVDALSSSPALSSGLLSLGGGTKRPQAATVLQLCLHDATQNFLLNEFPTPAMAELAGSFAPLLVTSPDGIHGPRRRESSVERVHQSRASIRHLRTTLIVYANLFDTAWSQPLLDDLDWYADVLGEARDLNVLREIVLPAEGNRDSTDVVVFEAYVEAVESARIRHLDACASPRYRILLEGLIRIDEDHRFAPEAFHRANRTLAANLEPAWESARNAAKTARRDRAARNLHRLRIRLKRLQYGAEIVASCGDRRAARVARCAEVLQRRLGSVHDADVAARWLAALGDVRPEYSPVLNERSLAMDQRAREARRGWHSEWNDVRRRWSQWRT